MLLFKEITNDNKFISMSDFRLKDDNISRTVSKKSITINTFIEDKEIDIQKIHYLSLNIKGSEIKALEGASKILENIKVFHVKFRNKGDIISAMDTILSEQKFKRKIAHVSPFERGDSSSLYIKEY